MFDGYFQTKPLAAQGELQMSRVRIQGVLGVQLAIETAENLIDFRLKLRYNITTNMRLRLKNNGLNRSM